MRARVVAIIPARYQSSRFPGKPLALIDERPMIEHVYTRARAVAAIDRVLVATDDPRIAEVVRGFGGEIVMTSPDHPSGTDRIAEVAGGLDCDIVVNVQGDLPFLEPEMVDRTVALMNEEPDLPMATVKTPIRDAAELDNRNVVKVVTDHRGYALYFSRSPLPCWRDGFSAAVLGYRHIGLYGYRRDFLLELALMQPTPLEKAEKLEQLRVLESGLRIRVAEVEDATGVEVDTPQDLERARAFWRAEGVHGHGS
ncbi:MAG TPA: 3-deoxy-manno-octulosonate cytidylyltransferase [Terriglobales bacterium]|nr:3-deoxy-manno-octulosonate cytidylyltransferase [Terriglobales bacterium]